jgi:hypothetical protein
VLEIDHRITAPLHLVIWASIFVWAVATERVSAMAAVAVAFGCVAALLTFHARAYWTTVRQDPVVSRTWGRIWHASASLAMGSLVIAMEMR